jgi:hypothetical protein
MSQDKPLPDFLRISSVDDPEFFVGDLFRRKFGVSPPAEGHHFVAFARDPEGSLLALGYTHFYPFGDIMLGGGACTDDRLLRRLGAEQRAAIAETGGLYFNVLRYALYHLRGRCEAYFGYCGDARAEAVDLRAGFVKTQHKHLLVYFHKPLHEVMQRALIAKAAAIGPF